MNSYLARQRAAYDQMRASIEALQSRAADEDRDLTDTEMTSVHEQGEQLRTLHAQITELAEIEQRNAQVAELALRVAGDQGPVPTGSTQTRDRDPGHYTRNSRYSFFSDLYHARLGDADASQRLAEHNRALTTGVAGAGVVPPHWLAEEFDLLARQGRGLCNAVRNIPLGDDPRPLTLPKQTTGTDGQIAQQATENTHPGEADAWASSTDTVTPKPFAGLQIVSRQMVDMSNPAIDALIYGDMIAAYNVKLEALVGAALVTAAGAAVTTLATEAAFTGTAPAMPATDAILDAAVAVRDNRKLPADILAVGVTRYGKLLRLKDTTGRPVIPQETAGPMNVVGVSSVAVDGRIQGLGVIATDGIGTTGTYPDNMVALRAADTLLFEGTMQTFRFEEISGPESIKLGIWCYAAVLVRQAGKSSKRVVITAA